MAVDYNQQIEGQKHTRSSIVNKLQNGSRGTFWMKMMSFCSVIYM